MDGAYPPSSNHPGIVDLFYADSHVDTISSAIELQAWRKIRRAQRRRKRHLAFIAYCSTSLRFL